MKTYALAAAGLLVAAMPDAAMSGEWRPLSQQSIDDATLDGWLASKREAEAVAAAAEADPTMPAVEGGKADEADPSADAVGQAIDTATARAAADGIDMPGIPQVPVAGADDLSVASPSYSTDSPDQAGLTEVDEPKQPDPFLLRLQVLLNRAHVSPGVIDGFEGENTHKAIALFETMRGLPADGEMDAETWATLLADQRPAMQIYTITAEDVDQRYVGQLPHDYAELAKLDYLGYRSPSEMLAEKFHVDEALLFDLNPTADLRKAGSRILVPYMGTPPVTKVTRIVVDKELGQLKAYDASGAIVMAAPATIGSDNTPSPGGNMVVETVVPEPTYSYSPKNFVQGDNTEPLTLPAGPNGPVGSTWIALSEPSYGIHGTPEPSLVAKTESHGCVRLSNWSAETLLKLVEPKVTTVEFVEKRVM